MTFVKVRMFSIQLLWSISKKFFVLPLLLVLLSCASSNSYEFRRIMKVEEYAFHAPLGKDDSLVLAVSPWIEFTEIDAYFSKLSGQTRYVISGDFQVINLGSCELLHIPKNFVTDKHSIPSPVRQFVSVSDYPHSALVHDFLYSSGYRDLERRDEGVYNGRIGADFLYTMLLVVEGKNAFSSSLRGYIVGLFGNAGYGKLYDYSFYDEIKNEMIVKKPPARNPFVRLSEKNCGKLRRYAIEDLTLKNDHFSKK